ncbi:MAG TPA: hypothetical protein PLG98_09845 [Smithella sp.]|nr:hypothetical protein [Smithella sp.]
MKKLFLSILVIILTISFMSWVIYLNQVPAIKQASDSKDIVIEPSPRSDDETAQRALLPDEKSKEISADQGAPATGKSVPAKDRAQVVPKSTAKKPAVSAVDETKKAPPVSGETLKKPQPAPSEKIQATPASEKSQKEMSRLQDQCEKRSKKIFRKAYGNGVVEKNQNVYLYLYKSHYNKKRDQCFMLVTEDGVLERYKKLLDVDENESLGSVRLNNERKNLGCYLLNSQCDSEETWDLLAKPYMEE